MYKSEVLVEVDVRSDPKTRVARWQEQVEGIQRRLGKNPSPNKRCSLEFQLQHLMGKLSAVPASPQVYV